MLASPPGKRCGGCCAARWNDGAVHECGTNTRMPERNDNVGLSAGVCITDDADYRMTRMRSE